MFQAPLALVSMLKSFISDLENRCKFTVKIAHMQKKL